MGPKPEGKHVVDSEDLKEHETTWRIFVRVVFYVTLAAALTLAALALILL